MKDQIYHTYGVIGYVWWRTFALAVALAFLELRIVDERPSTRVTGTVMSYVL